MKFSEALLLGSISTKQSTVEPSLRSVGDTGLCALETAVYAIGEYKMYSASTLYSTIEKAFPLLYKERVSCPTCKGREDLLLVIIYHLNDMHKWTRPRIAAFVEVIEQLHEKGGVTDVAKEHDSRGPYGTKLEPKLLQYQERTEPQTNQRPRG